MQKKKNDTEVKLFRRNEKRNPIRYSLLSRILCVPLLFLAGSLAYISTMSSEPEQAGNVYDSLAWSLTFGFFFIAVVAMQYFIKITRDPCGVRIVGVFVTTFVPWDFVAGCKHGSVLSLLDTSGKRHGMWAVQQANALDPQTSLPGRFERQLESEKAAYINQREEDSWQPCAGHEVITKHASKANVFVAIATITLVLFSCWLNGRLPWQL